MIIKKINEVQVKIKTDYEPNFDGFEIIIGERGNDYNNETIQLLISNDTQCCEKVGYFLTNDDVAEFIGAEFLKLNEVDSSLNVQTLIDDFVRNGEEYNESYCSTMFINIETNIGTLQFTAYNEHNGYYGHEAIVLHNGIKIKHKI